MPPFASAWASGSEARELVNTCLGRLGDVPPGASLGFLYASDALARELEHILHLLQQGTGVRHWVGSLGMALAATARELYDQPALAILVTDLPREAWRLLPNLTSDVRGHVAAEAAWLAGQPSPFGVLHGDPTNPATPTLVEQLSEALGEGFFTGGLTSSQSLNLQVADTVVSGGVSGVLFDAAVPVIADHTQGCTPIGPVHTVTEASRNIVAALDGENALAVLRRDVGEVLSRDLNRMAGYIFAGLPLAGSDRGDYMVRNLIGIDPERGLLAIGDMLQPGDRLLFCRRDGNTARDDMEAMLARLRDHCAGRQPRGALYFSCLGRGRHQFGADSAELRMIDAVFPDLPLAGFFANGEIFHNRLYGYTGVLTLFL